MGRMLKSAIALSVANQIARIVDPDRQCCRTPQFVRLIVTQIKDFPGRVADRIVRPGRQLVFTAITTPGAAAAGLRDHKAELGISDDIDPGGWCPLAAVEHNHVFASVIGKSAESVEEFERGCCQPGRMGSGRRLGLRDNECCHRSWAPQQLFG